MLKSAYATVQTDQTLHFLPYRFSSIHRLLMQTEKTQIRLHKCAVWSESSQFENAVTSVFTRHHTNYVIIGDGRCSNDHFSHAHGASQLLHTSNNLHSTWKIWPYRQFYEKTCLLSCIFLYFTKKEKEKKPSHSLVAIGSVGGRGLLHLGNTNWKAEPSPLHLLHYRNRYPFTAVLTETDFQPSSCRAT